MNVSFSESVRNLDNYAIRKNNMKMKLYLSNGVSLTQMPI